MGASGGAGTGSIPPAFAGVTEPRRSRERDAGSRPMRVTIPRARGFGTPCRRRSVPRPCHSRASDRRYADAPAGAFSGRSRGRSRSRVFKCRSCGCSFAMATSFYTRIAFVRTASAQDGLAIKKKWCINLLIADRRIRIGNMKCFLVLLGSAVLGILTGMGVVEPMAAYHVPAYGCLCSVGLIAGVLVGLAGC